MRFRARLTRLERMPPWRPTMNAMGQWEPPPGCPEPLWRALERYCDKRSEAARWPRNGPPFDLNDPSTVTRLMAAITKLCDLPADSTTEQLERAVDALMGDP